MKRKALTFLAGLALATGIFAAVAGTASAESVDSATNCHSPTLQC